MKISLRNLENSRLTLSEKDMEHLLGGGGGVRCGCLYAGTPGGATSEANHDANVAAGLWTVPPDGSGSSGSPRIPDPGPGYGWNGTHPAVSTYVKPPITPETFPPIPRKP